MLGRVFHKSEVVLSISEKGNTQLCMKFIKEDSGHSYYMSSSGKKIDKTKINKTFRPLSQLMH